jgi:hypothetical protein
VTKNEEQAAAGVEKAYKDCKKDQNEVEHGALLKQKWGKPRTAILKILKAEGVLARHNGCGNPILVKRATPILGSMDLRMPCVRKISPAATRMSATLAGPIVGLKKNRKGEFMCVGHPFSD